MAHRHKKPTGEKLLLPSLSTPRGEKKEIVGEKEIQKHRAEGKRQGGGLKRKQHKRGGKVRL